MSGREGVGGGGWAVAGDGDRALAGSAAAAGAAALGRVDGVGDRVAGERRAGQPGQRRGVLDPRPADRDARGRDSAVVTVGTVGAAAVSASLEQSLLIAAFVWSAPLKARLPVVGAGAFRPQRVGGGEPVPLPETLAEPSLVPPVALVQIR